MSLVDYYKAHQVFIDLGGYIIASNAIATMPVPTSKSSPFYTWTFNFLHAILLQAGRYFNKPSNNGNGTTTGQLGPPVQQSQWKPFDKEQK